MLKNYIKITLRNFYKNKLFSLINILGLAAGIACTIIILLFVQEELSYDQFHSKKDKIVRVTREWLDQDGNTSIAMARIAPAIGPLLQNDYPQIVESMVRVRKDLSQNSKPTMRYNDKIFVEDKFFWADKDFFKVFDFKFIKGNKETALSQPNSIVITQTIAEKIFGSEDPVGKIINYEKSRDLRVTGVVEDVPQNSHFKFTSLGSFVTLYDIQGAEFFETNWGENSFTTYFLLKGKNLEQVFQAQLPGFIDKYFTAVLKQHMGENAPLPASKYNVLHVQNLSDIHLQSHLSGEFEENGDITNVYLFSMIAVFILLIACINFMNLATAKSSKRAKEIGMRKVLGAEKKQLIYQFIGESLFISFLSLLLSIVLVEIVLPFLNSFIGKELSVNYFGNPFAVSGMIIITLLVGLVSGSYPAFFLSSYKPVSVLKGNDNKARGRSLFRTILVVSQFTISIILIISMIVVSKQMEYMRTKKLGFNKEQLVVLPSSGRMFQNLEGFKSILLQNINIKNVATSNLIPSQILRNNYHAKRFQNNSAVAIDFRLAFVRIDNDFLDTYQFELLAGRGFSDKFGADDSKSFIINENVAKKLGWSPQEAIGQSLIYGDTQGTVIGVLKDFNFESLHNEIAPVIFLKDEYFKDYFTVRVAGNIPGVLDFLRNVWQDYRPDYPFEYSFLNDDFAALYASEEQLGEIFGVFAFLAVFIACLGLFGLASFAAEQKTKEIGIRKVLGATVTNIVSRFTFDFVKLIIFANLIAWPLGYHIMNLWLNNFAYKINLSSSIFFTAGIITLVIAVVTVAFQAVNASLTNPAKTLKYE